MRRYVSVPLYWVIVGFAMVVISPILSIVVSTTINKRTMDAAEAAKQTALTTALVRYCRLFGAQADVYSGATTDVGRNAREVWLNEYRLSGCQPPK